MTGPALYVGAGATDLGPNSCPASTLTSPASHLPNSTHSFERQVIRTRMTLVSHLTVLKSEMSALAQVCGRTLPTH